MTVIERRESMGRDSGRRDQFPVGMRVLAVDDDPTCLKLLETLLLRCQYHVTTTNQAIKALKLLRENKDQFDLVISDVHMPDMDGFKLLELVGLEMDLPVIMLSANGETQAVMKGITHGACDYLLKPVRIEELKNIWQHVIRRMKFDARDHNNSDGGEDCDKAQLGNSECRQGPLSSGASDLNGKLNRKRKDQNEEEEEEDDDGEENMQENEDPSSQKKPRVVWSVDLHRKFVAAVNQLGIDKAVPKRILDLMNVERLTRENVASHLQKYRLYLRRLSAVANQQANMVAALRGRDPSYLPMGSLDGYANFNTLVGSRQLPAHTPGGVQPRMNSPAGFGLHGTVQFGSTYNNNTSSNPINDLGRLQGVTLPALQGNQHGTLLQGMPIGHHSGNSFADAMKSPLLIQPNRQQQHAQSRGLSNQSSVEISSLGSDPFEIGLGDSSPFADLGRCNDTWQGAGIGENVSPVVSHLGSNTSCDPSSGMGMTTGVNVDPKFLNFRSLGDPKLKWEEQRQDHAHNSNTAYGSSVSSSLPNLRINDRVVGNQTLNDELSNKKMDMPPMIISQTSIGGVLNYKDESIAEDMKLQGGFGSNGCTLDDLVNAMIKQEQRDDVTFIDGDLGFGDIYSLGACM